MRSILILVFSLILLCPSKAHGQDKFVYNLYYYVDPMHVPKTYKKIVVFLDAPADAPRLAKKYIKKQKFNVILSTDLFPPIKQYSESEISQKLNEIGADGLIYVNTDGTATSKNWTFGNISPTGQISMRNYQSQVVYINAYFIDLANKEKYVFYCSGSVNGKVTPACVKTMNYMLERFPKMNIAYHE